MTTSRFVHCPQPCTDVTDVTDVTKSRAGGPRTDRGKGRLGEADAQGEYRPHPRGAEGARAGAHVDTFNPTDLQTQPHRLADV